MHLDRTPDKHEAAMARADLYKLANYSMKLFKMIQEGQELEGWVQAKITKAADYVSSVYHFMQYEMKTSEYGDKLENSDVYSESVRRAFEQKLMEAKKQAEKIKKEADKVEEGFDDMEKYLKDKKGPQPSGGAGKKSGSPTVREFLEYFGTKIVRKIHHNAWSEYTIKKIAKEQSGIAIIPDVRFPNEVSAIQDNGGIVLRLTRNVYNSEFEAESALDKENFDWSKFDHVIDNQNGSVQDLCSEVEKLNHLWGSI